HLSAAAAGTVMAPMPVAFFVASLFAPRLLSRYGAKAVTIGIAIQATGLVAVLVTVLIAWPHLGFTNLLAGVVTLGGGQGLAMSPLFRIVLADSAPAYAGMSSGIMATTQQISMALGVAVIGTVLLTLAARTGMCVGLATALGCGAVLSAAAAGLSGRLCYR